METEETYTKAELLEKLTPKEKMFCHEYIIDWNGARAARVAGYKLERDRQTAHDNVTKSYIKQYINYIKNDFEKEAGLSKLKVLLEQTKIAFSSIAHLHETWIKRKEFDKLTDEQKSCIAEITTQLRANRNAEGEIEENEYVKVKLYDKQKSLESISKMMGYNEAEKINHEITDKRISKVNIHRVK